MSGEQLAFGATRDAVSGYPIQYAKVQPPPLREETLARDRLLDWLHAKIHSRVILILADAGYGKTTLLADFARRTRLRTLWYRLDDDDLDWTSIIHHLVAAGREHDPTIRRRPPLSMLAETSLSGPSREAVLDVFIRELPTIAPTGAVLILDDFHLVDEAPGHAGTSSANSSRGHRNASRSCSRADARPRSRSPGCGPTGRSPSSARTTSVSIADETARLFSETYGRTARAGRPGGCDGKDRGVGRLTPAGPGGPS